MRFIGPGRKCRSLWNFKNPVLERVLSTRLASQTSRVSSIATKKRSGRQRQPRDLLSGSVFPAKLE